MLRLCCRWRKVLIEVRKGISDVNSHRDIFTFVPSYDNGITIAA